MAYFIVWYFVVGLTYTVAIHLSDMELVDYTKAEWNTLDFWGGFFVLVLIWPYTIYSRNFT